MEIVHANFRIFPPTYNANGCRLNKKLSLLPEELFWSKNIQFCLYWKLAPKSIDQCRDKEPHFYLLFAPLINVLQFFRDHHPLMIRNPDLKTWGLVINLATGGSNRTGVRAAFPLTSQSNACPVKSGVHLILCPSLDKPRACRKPVIMPVYAGSFRPKLTSISRYFILKA